MIVDLESVSERMRAHLDAADVEYRAYVHRPVFSYADAALAREESGYDGTEGKVVVCRTNAGFVVCVTVVNERVDTHTVKRLLGVKKVSVASADELRAVFGAEPGAAYPFGFDDEITIVVDPVIYEHQWVLYSSGPPTQTFQIRGADLRKLFATLPSPMYEVSRVS